MAAEDYYPNIKKIIFSHLGSARADVYLFGSRAEGTAGSRSDVDVGILLHSSLPSNWWANLREALEESTVPYQVDIVDLHIANKSLKEKILKKGISWNGYTNESK